MPGHTYTSLVDVATGADCLIFLVEHKVVKQAYHAQRQAIEAAMRTPLVLRFYQDD